MSELSLEREKIQIERERLALERERWSAERDKMQVSRELANRAAGRLTIGISTLSLALLSALLAGGAIGAWLVTRNQQQAGHDVAASLIQAFGSGTNALDEAEGQAPWLRSLGRQGRPGGYLLILN
jgi:hypothetical protein